MKFLKMDKQMLKNIFTNYTSCKWIEVGIDSKSTAQSKGKSK